MAFFFFLHCLNCFLTSRLSRFQFKAQSMVVLCDSKGSRLLEMIVDSHYLWQMRNNGFLLKCSFLVFGTTNTHSCIFFNEFVFSPAWPEVGESSLHAGAEHSFRRTEKSDCCLICIFVFSFILSCWICILLHLTIKQCGPKHTEELILALSLNFSPASLSSFHSYSVLICLSPNYPHAESSEILHLMYSK